MVNTIDSIAKEVNDNKELKCMWLDLFILIPFEIANGGNRLSDELPFDEPKLCNEVLSYFASWVTENFTL